MKSNRYDQYMTKYTFECTINTMELINSLLICPGSKSVLASKLLPENGYQ